MARNAGGDHAGWRLTRKSCSSLAGGRRRRGEFLSPRSRTAAQAQEYPAPVLMTSAGREREQVALVTDTCRVSLDKSELTPDRPPISGRALCVSTCPFGTLASHALIAAVRDLTTTISDAESSPSAAATANRAHSLLSHRHLRSVDPNLAEVHPGRTNLWVTNICSFSVCCIETAYSRAVTSSLHHYTRRPRSLHLSSSASRPPHLLPPSTR